MGRVILLHLKKWKTNNTMKKAPEQFRLKPPHKMGSTESYGNNGVFVVPIKGNSNMMAICICSDGEGWEHVSVHVDHKTSKTKRCPTWEEMCQIKDLFWDDTETVIQYHPPATEYVNNHKYCLHLWKPIGIEIPLPPSILVGIR